MGGPLKKYRYTSPASGAETVLKLNEDDAARLGLTEDDVLPDTAHHGEHGPELLSPPVVQEDARAEPSGDDSDDGLPEVKARTATRNKARTAATKTSRRRRKPPGDADDKADAGDGEASVADSGGDGGQGGGD
ncbi:hypothetical protein ACFXCZ_27100 [Streptomyces sp. NPDC059396]|uniref:hypothetical protein n=1 Tax=Streptomyces sp. NPDC059396 TaxID=3346819 RepID=UPI00369C3ED3